MLEKIRVMNFKAHADTTIELKPITVFIGPNNSGKSTLFQLLMLFKQCQSQNVPSNSLYPYSFDRYPSESKGKVYSSFNFLQDILIDLGDDRIDLLQDILKPLIINIEGYANLQEEKIKKIGCKQGKVNIHMEYNDELHLEKVKYNGEIDDEYKVMLDNDNTTSNNIINEFIFPGYDITTQFNFDRNVLTPFSISTSGSSGIIDNKIRKKADIIGRNIGNLFSNLIGSIHFVYGIRGFEVFCEPLTGLKVNKVEYVTLSNRSLALGNASLSSGELQEKIQKWFNNILGIKIYPELYNGTNVTFKLKGNKNRLLINEGLGSQQMLHMFIPIAIANKNDTIIIEEPEIHLHPRTQAELMELLIKVNKEENKQLIMSTHSEHIIYPLLLAISKKIISNKDINIVYFSKENGKVKIKPLEIDEKGRVKGGLPGFFEQNLQEISDYLEL